MMAPEEGLIQPFNLDPVERKKMYSSPLPEQLAMNVTILFEQDRCDGNEQSEFESIRDELDMVVRNCVQDAARFGIPSKVDYKLGYHEEVTEGWWSLSKLQQQWQHNGVYVQVDFLNPVLSSHSFDPHYGRIVSMTIYDRLVSVSGGLSPSLLTPFITGSKLAENYKALANDIYAEGAGVWTQGLVEFRNMVMIKSRAVLTFQNPDAEYDRFVKAGGKYFLDYPRICP